MGMRIFYNKIANQNDLVLFVAVYSKQSIDKVLEALGLLQTQAKAPWWEKDVKNMMPGKNHMMCLPDMISSTSPALSVVINIFFTSWYFIVSGGDLAETITCTLENHKLDLTHCRGQAYDGAANMAGAINGCAAIIRRQYPLAIRQHCRSHVLNLSVMKWSELQGLQKWLMLPIKVGRKKNWNLWVIQGGHRGKHQGLPIP